MDRNVLLEAARQVRDELPALMGADATDLGMQLNDLLDRPDATVPIAEVVDLLASDGRTRRALRERVPQADEFRSGGDAELPGLAHPPDVLSYRCGVCGYEYPIFDVGEPVPDCPNGHGQLDLDA